MVRVELVQPVLLRLQSAEWLLHKLSGALLLLLIFEKVNIKSATIVGYLKVCVDATPLIVAVILASTILS